MPNITAPAQISFSDNIIRLGANLLVSAYNSCKLRQTRWAALGSGAGALTVMATEIGGTADFLCDVMDFCFRNEKLWFLLGGAVFIPNDAAQPVFDGQGAQDPARPPMNAANINILIAQVIAYRQWLQNGGFATGGTAGNYATYNTVLQVSSRGPRPIVLADAINFITRCGEIVTNYEATSNSILNNVLVCAPNSATIR